MKEPITRTEANDAIFAREKDDLKSSLRALSSISEKIEDDDFDEFNSMAIFATQIVRSAYKLESLRESAWLELESKRPMTEYEKQIEKHSRKARSPKLS